MRALLVAALVIVTSPALAQDPLPADPRAFTMQSGQPRANEQTQVRFDQADLTIKVIPEEKRIEGVAVLDFTATTGTIYWLPVELDERLYVSAIAVDGVDLYPDDNWRHEDGRLWIDLGRDLEPGQSVQLRIAYSGRPHVAENAPWSGGFVWATTPSGEPWIATAVQGEGCDLFWPCIDHPLSEPGRVNLHITVPTGLVAPSNGRFLGSEDHGDGWTTWNWTAANPNTYAIALNIGPYEELTATYESRFGNRFPMSFWHLKSTPPERAAALFAEFAPMLDFHEATVGPFPFGDEKMGVVETPHLGMEHQTINAYGNGYRLDGRGYDWLLQHELAHEWFGNQMTSVDADDLWLHEGLGSYMQPLYGRWLHGDRYMQTELATLQRDLVNRFPVVSGRHRTDREVSDGPGNDIYFKGALFAHTLRMLIGDEAFFEAITTLVYGRPDPGPGNFTTVYRSTRDFINIVNSVTGEDYDWLFQGYLYNAALPVLTESREGTTLALSWTTGDGAAFPMPVEVEIDGEGRTLAMPDGRGRITVPEGAHVIIDPANKVLRQLDFIDAWRARPSS
jgi:aminopeptidase N